MLFNINAANPGGGNNGRPLAITGRTVDETFIEPVGMSSYNALQAQLDRSFSNGLQVKASYTFSKTIDNVDNELGSLLFYDAANIARNRALAGFDRTAQSPTRVGGGTAVRRGETMGAERSRRRILGGWEINGIFSAYSGTPFTVTASGSSLNAPGQTQTADQVKADVAKPAGIGSAAPYYDPTAFAAVTQVRYGTTGRNILRGPGLVNVDGSLFRNFRFRERVTAQLRGEAYNVTNTPHFNNPSANISSGGFMTITSALSRSNNVEGGERQFRVALKLSF